MLNKTSNKASSLDAIVSSDSTTLNVPQENTKEYCEFTSNDETILLFFARIIGKTLRSSCHLRDAEVSRDRASGLLTLLQSLKQV